VISLLTFLPDTRAHISTHDDIAIPLPYLKLESRPSSEEDHTDCIHPENDKTQIQRLCHLQHLQLDMIASLKCHVGLMLHNCPFNIFRAIMFLDMVALNARSLLRPWLSKDMTGHSHTQGTFCRLNPFSASAFCSSCSILILPRD
jgi:hypothetical protein